MSAAYCKAGGAEVMVVSASSLKSLDDAEVDVDLQFARSPAKVICHSPARLPAVMFRLSAFKCYVLYLII